MSEYIKREDAAKVICGECLNYAACYSGNVDIPVCPLFWDLQNIPTADVVERKVGRWIERTYDSSDTIFESHKKVGWGCSKCGLTWDARTHYCPNCGADMREDGDT